MLALLSVLLLPKLSAQVEAENNRRKWERRDLLKGCSLAVDDITTNKMTFECPLGVRRILPRHWRADLETP